MCPLDDQINVQGEMAYSQHMQPPAHNQRGWPPIAHKFVSMGAHSSIHL